MIAWTPITSPDPKPAARPSRARKPLTRTAWLRRGLSRLKRFVGQWVAA